jgi:predicted adenine nucleotide alpha hydrolase (AANH) superfamily ATPase
MKPKLLLHICCAPCSTYVVETLKKDYDVSGYFYNPNIHPKEEYEKRELEMNRYARMINLELVCAEYDDDRWFQMAEGMEDQPEGGERCKICYKIRLENTARYAIHHGYDFIATTLSISPHKNADKINQVGAEVSDQPQLKWHAGDFKKQGGFEKSIQMSKQASLYRQSYCGCIFSLKEAEKNRKRK